MRVTTIQIEETVNELKALMNSPDFLIQKERIHALYLIKSKQCQQIKDLARIMGKTPKTIYKWFEIYRQDGIKAFTDNERKRSGRKRVIPLHIQNQLRQKLKHREFSNYQQILDWLRDVHFLKVKYHVVRELVLYKFQIKLTNYEARK